MYEKLCDFQNLYKAHKLARRGKRGNREVILFEMNLAENLVKLQQALQEGTYRVQGYYTFPVHDPKERTIHALHYRDRVVQHALCDEILSPVLEKHLIYDNAACRIGKGTDFALDRTEEFMRRMYRAGERDGWILRFDIRKFFDNIDHEILKQRLRLLFTEEPLYALLCGIIDSYHTLEGKGLPLGNQTSQWFALWYLDPLDRLIKEKLRLKYYSRYMDDGVILHPDREYLKRCLREMTELTEKDLKLVFNEKTQLSPMKNGANYLGWHLYLTETGKVVRKLKRQSKVRARHRLKRLEEDYRAGRVGLPYAQQVIKSYFGHLSHGNTWRLRKKLLCSVTLTHEPKEDTKKENLSPTPQPEQDDKISSKVGDKLASLNKTQKRILEEMEKDPHITQPQLMQKLNLGRTAIQNHVSFLRKNGFIERIGANKNGTWEIMIRSEQ